MNDAQRQAISWLYEVAKQDTNNSYYNERDAATALRHLNAMAEMFGEQGRWSIKIISGTDHWLFQR